MNAIPALAGVVIKELYRRKDFYVLFVLTALIGALMVAATWLKDEKMAGYLKEMSLLLIWISALVIAVGIAARQLPAEREQRTIFPLLAKPVTRGEVIAGKFLGCWLAAGAALAVFYIFFGIIIAACEHELRLTVWLQAVWLQWMFLGMVIALALWGSLVLPSPATNATFCIVVVLAVLLLGHQFSGLGLYRHEPARTVIEVLALAVPHFEWFDMRDAFASRKAALPWGYFTVATLYAAGYAGFFLFGAWLGFRRKALNT